MKNIINTTNITKLKNTLLAAFIFGSLGAYAGIQTIYAIDARQDDRINAMLKANHTIATAPATAPATVPTVPATTATPLSK